MRLGKVLLVIGGVAIAQAHSHGVSVVEKHSHDLTAPLFHSNGVINIARLDAGLSQCEVVEEINRFKEEQHDKEETSFIESFFDILFPLGPAGNCLLATSYISGPPNLILAFVPSSFDVSNLNFLVSFATGGLLGDVFLHLLPEVFFGESLDHSLSFVYVDERRNIVLGFFIFVGFLMFFTIDKLLRITQHTGDVEGSSHSHSHTHSTALSSAVESKDTSTLRKRNQPKKEEQESVPIVSNPSQSIKTSAYLNLISDFTHNITDGIAISASFYISRNVGATTALAVFVHEFPHEMGDFALLIQGGFTKWQLMASQFVTAIGAYLGTFIGIYIQSSFTEDVSTKLLQDLTVYKGLFSTSVTVSDLALPFTAGGFLYIATVGVIPEVLELEQGTTKFDELKKFIGQLFFMFIGIGLMFYISWNH